MGIEPILDGEVRNHVPMEETKDEHVLRLPRPHIFARIHAEPRAFLFPAASKVWPDW